MGKIKRKTLRLGDKLWKGSQKRGISSDHDGNVSEKETGALILTGNSKLLREEQRSY